MNNRVNGKKFETKVKKMFNDSGKFKAFKLAIPETADVIIVNKKTYLIECKTSHEPIWTRHRNPEQFFRLKEISKTITVITAIKFVDSKKHKANICFYVMNEARYPYLDFEGLSFEELLNRLESDEQ